MSTKRLLTNSSSNLLVMFLKIAITLVMTPIFVHNLGAYDYGVWEITLSVIGYMGILDLGMLPTMARFAAHHRARAEEEQLFQTFALCGVYGGYRAVVGHSFSGVGAIFPRNTGRAGSGDYPLYHFLADHRCPDPGHFSWLCGDQLSRRISALHRQE